MSTPLTSIIIPYFNGHEYAMAAVTSAISQTYPNIEVILIDDGSNNPESISYFDQIHHPLLKKIRTKNQGLAMARNAAISAAKGEFILPLDCDDLISNTYVEKGVEEFLKNNSVGIVYSHACFFGAVNQYWELPEFNKLDFLVNNCIFSSGLFKKSDWVKVGGYKSDMIYGLEDYDFWLSLVSLEKEVIKLPEIHFFYRKHGQSMISNMNAEKLVYSYSRILERHQFLYQSNLLGLLTKINQLNSEKLQLENDLRITINEMNQLKTA